MFLGRRTTLSMGLVMLFGAMMALGSSSALAQDATPIAAEAAGRPAHIHMGSCPEVGDVVAPLTDLTLATGATETVGTPVAADTGAIPAEYSFTTVPLSLDDILAGEHAINVHESAENIGNYIACGDLAGTVDANGSLVVGLREVNDSGFAGIAVLSPSAQAGSTDVSVFIASGLTEDDGI